MPAGVGPPTRRDTSRTRPRSPGPGGCQAIGKLSASSRWKSSGRPHYRSKPNWKTPRLSALVMNLTGTAPVTRGHPRHAGKGKTSRRERLECVSYGEGQVCHREPAQPAPNLLRTIDLTGLGSSRHTREIPAL